MIRRPINGFEADKLTRRTRLYAMDRFVVIFIFKSSGVVESKLVGVHIDILYCFFVARIFFCCQVFNLVVRFSILLPCFFNFVARYAGRKGEWNVRLA